MAGWIVVGGVVVLVAIGCYAIIPRAATTAPDSSAADLAGSAPYGGGIFRPPTVPATVAQLGSDELVIGVKVHDRTRAYRRAAFVPVLDHVVNDVIDGVPVSVTYCDRCDCTRVFTGDGSEPLELVAAAFQEGLLLRVRGRLYRQDTGEPADHSGSEFPYWTMEFEQTTWMEWRAENPETDVYLGRPTQSGGG